ncbi:MAG TPA: hypothetical protein VLG50_06940 [Candidatus Saccharimonadales bacterium]|nr:hypothetical protein [Candidatus Saccharimonadales bacterium]
MKKLLLALALLSAATQIKPLFGFHPFRGNYYYDAPCGVDEFGYALPCDDYAVGVGYGYGPGYVYGHGVRGYDRGRDYAYGTSYTGQNRFANNSTASTTLAPRTSTMTSAPRTSSMTSAPRTISMTSGARSVSSGGRR